MQPVVLYTNMLVTFCKAMGLQMMSICKVTGNKLIKINTKNYIIQNTIGQTMQPYVTFLLKSPSRVQILYTNNKLSKYFLSYFNRNISFLSHIKHWSLRRR